MACATSGSVSVLHLPLSGGGLVSAVSSGHLSGTLVVVVFGAVGCGLGALGEARGRGVAGAIERTLDDFGFAWERAIAMLRMMGGSPNTPHNDHSRHADHRHTDKESSPSWT